MPPNKKSLAVTLLKVVFGIYFVFTAVVTCIQVFIQFEDSRQLVIKELKAVEESNHLALSQAYWNLDDEQIEKMADGLIQLKVVTALTFSSVTETDKIHRGNPSQSDHLITHQFTLTYPDSTGSDTILAEVFLYSNTDVVIERIETGVYILIASAILKTLVLWLLLLWTFKKFLTNPLSQLSDSIQSVDLNQLENQHIQLVNKDNNELKQIETAFNKMLDTLGLQRSHLLELEQSQLDKSKQHNEELKELLIKAEAATVAKSQFLATMSHEIRTPMNGVIGMAQLLEDTELNDEQKDYLEGITSSGNNLLNIINDILDFSKLEAGKVDLEHISFDLEHLCQECMQLILSNNLDKRIEYIFDYEPNCPRYFYGDPSRLRQVLLNLLSNANKFTEEGYIRLGISGQQLSDDKVNLNFEVQDTGIGLKPDARDHLFEEFTQADSSTTRKFGGTGLGLSISEKLVKLMGCHIGVNSEYGEGSTFWFEGQFDMAKAPKPMTETSLNNVRILLIDENKIKRRILHKQLSHMQADITMVDDALDVLELLEQAIEEKNPYQLAIIDLSQSSEADIKLAHSIREKFDHNILKLLIISCSSQKGRAVEFEKTGFDAFLSRFTRYDILKAMLSATLSLKKKQSIITQYSIAEAQQSENNETFEANILLAEDVLPNQIIANTFLTRLGATVTIANNGEEALNRFKENIYDLVFMDCRMPVMDGYEATKAIREYETKTNKQMTPIIALTANASDDDKKLCKDAGMNEIITKPFKRNEITQCLSQWLKSSSQE